MATSRSKQAKNRQQGTSRPAEPGAAAEPAALLAQYGCGPIQFSGTSDALYERHLLFDSVRDLTSAGARERFEAVARSVRAGVPVNVTLLFSPAQYVAAAEAFLRGIERRIDVGRDPTVASVASVFVSRWDAAVAGAVPAALRNQLGIAVAKRTYAAYRRLLDSPRWQRAANAGARPQRLLWASTGTKDPHAPDTLYVEALAAPFTVDTMPEATLQALADHGDVHTLLPVDGGDCEEVLTRFRQADIDVDAMAARLQDEGATAFVKSWNELLSVIAAKSNALAKVG